MKITGLKRNGRNMFLLAIVILLSAYLLAPVYVQEALIHWFPDISDTYLFPAHTLKKADAPWEWPNAADYNTYTLSKAENDFLDEYGTVAYLIIRNDSVVYEEYRDGWEPHTLSNIFSATKSIVGLLVGVAHDEGYIENLDDKVSKYLPEFKEGGKDKITVRHLLTMSSGLNWDEAYTSLFSATTEAYYGDHIRELVMNLQPVEEPGKRYSYKSGDTQILSFLLEAALEKVLKDEKHTYGKGLFSVDLHTKAYISTTISEYAQAKLWQPMQAAHDALWNLDRENGDEKSYCCFNTTARDLARLGRLILHQGNWNGKQLISEEYIQEAITPASYLENEFGDGPLDYYGFQIWIMRYGGMQFPLFRGLGGQYMIAIPQKNAIIVRLGHKRSDVYDRELTQDIRSYLDIAFRILQ